MKWSWRIAAVAGIDIYIHGTFFLLIIFILVSEWQDSHSVTAAAAGAVFVLAIFATVVLHELGHALTAKRYGIKTRDITLLPIGGIARLERMPDVPRQELWVALAGPAVNLVIAAVCYAGYVVIARAIPTLTLDPRPGGVMGRFISVNLALAAFNMLPAFPMDGGRALRALLAERLDYVRATELAAYLGQGLALILGFLGLFSNPFLVFIALFVWMGASGEASAVTLRSALSGVPVSRGMITDFHSLDVAQPLRDAAALVIAGSQRDFPVLDRDQLAGILTRDGLVRGLAERGVDAEVGTAMTTGFETADAREMLDTAFVRLQQSDCPVMPVVSAGRVVGLLTSENVGEFLMIRGALGPRKRPNAPLNPDTQDGIK